MTPKFRFIGLLFLTGLLTSCELVGQLKVFETITLKKGSLFFVLEEDYDPGTYKVEIEKKRRGLELTIREGFGRDRFLFKTDQDLPTENGSFTLSSSESGQPYDLKGDLETTVTESGTFSSTESCVYDTRWVQKCDYHSCHTHGDTQCCDHHCRMVEEPIYGTQPYEYYNRYTDTKGVFKLLKPSTGRQVAKGTGEKGRTEQVRTWTGTCHL